MDNRDEILAVIKKMMQELFEIEEDAVTLETHLYQDLDFDSIDAIDMIVQLEKVTKRSIKPNDFRDAKTIKDVVDVVFKLINN